jgi:hypothetical protein
MIVFKAWHNVLKMERKSKDWHDQDVADELAELIEANKFTDRWSEYSDVVYTVTRGRHGGHNMQSPISKRYFVYGSVYMFPKYTLRWLFFKRVGKRLNSQRPVREVRNPKKLHKLEHIANKYGLSPDEFVHECQKQLKYWPLLK